MQQVMSNMWEAVSKSAHCLCDLSQRARVGMSVFFTCSGSSETRWDTRLVRSGIALDQGVCSKQVGLCATCWHSPSTLMSHCESRVAVFRSLCCRTLCPNLPDLQSSMTTVISSARKPMRTNRRRDGHRMTRTYPISSRCSLHACLHNCYHLLTSTRSFQGDRIQSVTSSW